ncbi:Cofactor of BRCA1 [Pseudocyphellaria aurata]|nr:Cofactor of BRCA1 [Pseudocyphellaria aurata]
MLPFAPQHGCVQVQDPWYKMAWTLEACINDKGLAADDKRLQSLKAYFISYDRPPSGAVAPARKKQRFYLLLERPKLDLRRMARVGSLGDAESQGVPSRDSSPALGDAAMCLRDPSALYLLVHQVLRRLHAVIKAEGQPSHDDHLVFLTRLIQLACSARTQLRDNRYSFAPASNEMMSVVYPCLIDCLIDAEDRPDPSAVVPGQHLALCQSGPDLSTWSACLKLARHHVLPAMSMLVIGTACCFTNETCASPLALPASSCSIWTEQRVEPSKAWWLAEEEVDGEQIRELVTLLTKEEVVRKVTQGLALERLGLSDLATAQVVLTALQQALDKTSDKALAEWAPFAATLAQRMVRLVKGGRVAAGSPLWLLIVDRLLLRLIDTDVQAQPLLPCNPPAYMAGHSSPCQRIARCLLIKFDANRLGQCCILQAQPWSALMRTAQPGVACMPSSGRHCHGLCSSPGGMHLHKPAGATQVQEELLYCLQQVADTKGLSTAQLAHYLQTMLRSTKRSRRWAVWGECKQEHCAGHRAAHASITQRSILSPLHAVAAVSVSLHSWRSIRGAPCISSFDKHLVAVESSSHWDASGGRAMARHQDRTKAMQQYSASGMGYTSEGGYTSAGGYASGTYGGYSTSGSEMRHCNAAGMLSDGYGLKAGSKGSDSVKHLYRSFPAKHPQLTPTTAPDLFEYLGADANVS